MTLHMGLVPLISSKHSRQTAQEEVRWSHPWSYSNTQVCSRSMHWSATWEMPWADLSYKLLRRFNLSLFIQLIKYRISIFLCKN